MRKLFNPSTVLSTRRFWNDQYLLDVNGGVSTDFEIEFEDKTEAWESCTVQYRGALYIYGGWKQRTQISMLKGCKVERVGSLPFRLGLITISIKLTWIFVESRTDTGEQDVP